MYESCLAVGAVVAADDRDSLADVSFDPLTVAYDEEEDAGDTNGEEANERAAAADADATPRLATRASKLPAELPRARTAWFVTAPSQHPHAARFRPHARHREPPLSNATTFSSSVVIVRVVSVIALRHRPPPPTTTLTDDDDGNDDRNEDEDDVDVVVAPRYRVAARRSIETIDRSIDQSINPCGWL